MYRYTQYAAVEYNIFDVCGINGNYILTIRRIIIIILYYVPKYGYIF